MLGGNQLQVVVGGQFGVHLTVLIRDEKYVVQGTARQQWSTVCPCVSDHCGADTCCFVVGTLSLELAWWRALDGAPHTVDLPNGVLMVSISLCRDSSKTETESRAKVLAYSSVPPSASSSVCPVTRWLEALSEWTQSASAQ